MDERTSTALRLFKRRGAAYIMVPALIVALVVAVGVGGVLIRSFGKSMASGLNGVVAGSLGASSSADDDPQALRDLKKHIDALKELGQFAAVTVKASDGRVLATTEDSRAAMAGLDGRERAAVERGESSAYIGRCDCGDLEFMVVGPLTRAEGAEPYGVVRGHRKAVLVLPTVAITVAVFVLVILLGAVTALLLLRRLVNRTEAALDEDQRVIDALDRRLEISLRELEEHSVGTLQALVAAVDAKDTYTAHHSLNVSDYACAIARHMGHGDQVSQLERAGLLHDIGKIGVSEYALLKPGRLTPEEYASIQEHSEIGARIVEMAPFLAEIVPVVRHHHECWDGSGYPTGLSGEEIPLLARILCVADALDAMTTDRAYRTALSASEARQELLDARGTQFDSAVVDAAVHLLDSRRIVL